MSTPNPSAPAAAKSTFAALDEFLALLAKQDPRKFKSDVPGDVKMNIVGIASSEVVQLFMLRTWLDREIRHLSEKREENSARIRNLELFDKVACSFAGLQVRAEFPELNGKSAIGINTKGEVGWVEGPPARQTVEMVEVVIMGMSTGGGPGGSPFDPFAFFRGHGRKN